MSDLLLNRRAVIKTAAIATAGGLLNSRLWGQDAKPAARTLAGTGTFGGTVSSLSKPIVETAGGQGAGLFPQRNVDIWAQRYLPSPHPRAGHVVFWRQSNPNPGRACAVACLMATPARSFRAAFRVGTIKRKETKIIFCSIAPSAHKEWVKTVCDSMSGRRPPTPTGNFRSWSYLHGGGVYRRVAATICFPMTERIWRAAMTWCNGHRPITG